MDSGGGFESEMAVMLDGVFAVSLILDVKCGGGLKVWLSGKVMDD